MSSLPPTLPGTFWRLGPPAPPPSERPSYRILLNLDHKQRSVCPPVNPNPGPQISSCSSNGVKIQVSTMSSERVAEITERFKKSVPESSARFTIKDPRKGLNPSQFGRRSDSSVRTVSELNAMVNRPSPEELKAREDARIAFKAMRKKDQEIERVLANRYASEGPIEIVASSDEETLINEPEEPVKKRNKTAAKTAALSTETLVQMKETLKKHRAELRRARTFN